MPTSYPENISSIICFIRSLKPKSVLDIGPGFGKYGLLCREYLDIWNKWVYAKDKWSVRIDCLEAFPDYITPVHKYIYNNIYIGDAIEVIPTLKSKYEIALLIDVFEHFTKEEGEKLISNLKKKAKSILIAIPKKPGKQEDVM
jgi:hypothetical protein